MFGHAPRIRQATRVVKATSGYLTVAQWTVAARRRYHLAVNPGEDGDEPIIDPSVGPPTPEEIDPDTERTPLERPRLPIIPPHRPRGPQPIVPEPTPMPPAEESA